MYTETIPKLPHTEECKHDSGEGTTVIDPKNYTFTQHVKMMYTTKDSPIYSDPYNEVGDYATYKKGEPIPVVAKCDQADFYKTIRGTIISGKDLTEEYPLWSGTYRANGYEVHADNHTKVYVERQVLCVNAGPFKPVYRETNSTMWNGAYEMMIGKDTYFMASEFSDWLIQYLKANGIEAAVSSLETLPTYLLPLEEGEEGLTFITVAVGK